MTVFTTYTCSGCEKEMQEDEFMAVIGQVPAGGMVAPIGRADAILEAIGEMYCESCFEERFEQKQPSQQ